jgi:hypothetical protein
LTSPGASPTPTPTPTRTPTVTPVGTLGTNFTTMTPCRVADTRLLPPGPQAGPSLLANTARDFPVTGVCGVPAGAKAVAINVTVALPTADGYLTLYPAGSARPLASTLNFRAGAVRANNAVVPLGVSGQITVFCGMPDSPSGTTDFVLDVTGWFE